MRQATETLSADIATDASIHEAKDRRYFAELVRVLEERVDVNAIVAADIKLWPLIRWELARGIKGTAVQDDVGSAVNEVRGEGFTGGREERVEIMRRQRDAERARYPDAQSHRAEQFERLKTLGPCDYLVCSKVEKYYQPVDGKFYSPILDPVYEDLRVRGKTHVIGLEPLDIECINEPTRISADPYMRLTSRMQKEDACAVVAAQLAHINSVLEEVSPAFRLDVERLNIRLNRYRRRVLFFEDVLRATRPRAVFVSSFVGWAPLIWAARKQGVVTIDIQHGGQSPFHYHTTHWSKLPSDGYELLPDVFWVWGNAIRDFITPWLPASAERHIPVVGGQRYVAKCLRGSPVLDESEDGRTVVAHLAGGERTVLVTLGYSVEEILPDTLREAIARTPTWRWLIRMHPINRGEAAIREIQAKTVDSGLENVEFQASTRLPLYTVLTLADFHVTPFSTTCREAAAVGIDSAITHPIGKTYFAEEIAAGEFIYAETAQAIIEAASERPDGPRSVERGVYIETADSLVDDVMEVVESLCERAASRRASIGPEMVELPTPPARPKPTSAAPVPKRASVWSRLLGKFGR